MERPIVARSIVTEKPVYGNTENGVRQTGYTRVIRAAKLHITLRPGTVESGVNAKNQIVEITTPGVYASFDDRGVLEVTEAQWKDAGKSREECVAFLRKGSVEAGYELVGEDEKSDGRKPIPAGAK